MVMAIIIDFAWNFIDNLITNILILLRIKSSIVIAAQDMHFIEIKYGSLTHIMPLKTNSDVTVADIKQQLVAKMGLTSVEDIGIIFAGKELADDLCVRECDLGQNSVVHAVKVKRKQNDNSNRSDNKLLSESVATLTLMSNRDNEIYTDISSLPPSSSTQQSRSATKSHFHIYCSACKCVTNGKLRVICAKCKNATLTVNRDPHEWNDVLIPGRISGVCQSDSCNGDSALFYFKCSSFSHSDSYQDNCSIVLYLLRNNSIGVSCLACTDIKPIVLVFTCASRHVICIDCFKDYCLSRLNERKFIIDAEIGYSLGCAVGCGNSLIRETHHFRVMGELAYNKYQSFAAEECLLSAGGVICPRPDCGTGIMIEQNPEDLKCNKITCLSCGFVFCRMCLQGYHIGDCLDDLNLSNDLALRDSNLTDNIDANSADHAKWDDQLSRSAIKLMSKPCPSCRTPTERDGGCMHMICTRANCGYNWCWVCQTEWNRECMGNHWFG